MQTWMAGPRSSPAQAPSRCWLSVGEALSTPKTGPVCRAGFLMRPQYREKPWLGLSVDVGTCKASECTHV